jgi:hypothetical protein
LLSGFDFEGEMMRDIKTIEGLVFLCSSEGQEYGPLRSLDAADNSTVALPEGSVPFAEDECGNFFIMTRNGQVGFFDHETDHHVVLAENWDQFVTGCRPATPITLDPSQVRSAWIDPEFARKLGLDAPKDGWVKRT